MAASPLATAALLLLAVVIVGTVAFDIRDCGTPLGMESGAIPDAAISASSAYISNVGPHYARLRVDRAGGAWCPRQLVERGVREWLRVDLGEVHLVTGVDTQGRFEKGRGQEYTEEYTLEYWRPGLDAWRQYSRFDGKKILSGNSDTATVVSHRLMPPFYASRVRVLPYSVHRRTVCLRLELRGCFADSGVVEYSLPVPAAAADAGADLADSSYDGERRGALLTGGLGRLVDGDVGGDNFRLDIGYGRGSGWVGWQNDSVPGKCVELLFEFDVVRNFSAVHLFTNNFFSKHVQVFSRARVFFSVGGRFFNGRPLSFSYMPDLALEHARNVTIKLHGRVGRFVKLQLYFAARWILLSEVTFDSLPLDANLTAETEANVSEDEIVVGSDGDDPWDTLETIAAPSAAHGYVEVVIGVLTAVMLLLLLAFVVVLLVSRRHKLQGSPTILRNPFGVTVNMKDLLMNLAPVNGVSGALHPSHSATSGGGGGGLGAGGCGGSSASGSAASASASAAALLLTFEQHLAARGPGTGAGSVPAREASGLSALSADPSLEPSLDLSNDLSGELSAALSVDLPPGSSSGEDEARPPRPPTPPTPSTSPSASPTPSPSPPPPPPPAPAPAPPPPPPQPPPQPPQRAASTPPAGGFGSLPFTRGRGGAGGGGGGGSMGGGRAADLAAYFPRAASAEPAVARRRFHTAPRERLRAPPPVISWNLAPAMGQAYRARELEPARVTRACLRVVERVGASHAGEVLLCAADGVAGAGRLVAVRATRPRPQPTPAQSPASAASVAAAAANAAADAREARLLAGLQDPNIARVLGVCTSETPTWLVLEYSEMGDLAHYLQYREPAAAAAAVRPAARPAAQLQALSFGCLLHMATQVASAMKYLESRNIVHKDLAARNCLVGRGYEVKVTDIAMCSNLYKKDYSEIGGRPPAPIRWLPWESVLLERYTCASSSWSFAVTLWEILSLAREKPFQHLSDERVVQNAEHMYYGGELQVLLPKPPLCPVDIYDVMCECWRRDERARPTFRHIYAFLKCKNVGYHPGD